MIAGMGLSWRRFGFRTVAFAREPILAAGAALDSTPGGSPALDAAARLP
jgi:hypothetical protein